MSIPKDILNENPELSRWAIMLCYRGSIAHGMYVPNKDPNSVDDKDVLAICVPPDEYYLGLKSYGSRGTRTIFEGEWDIVVYEARKAINLLAKGNPNALMLLWLEDKHYLTLSKAGRMLLENRDAFVGRHVYHRFVGYARAQLHKMTHLAFEGYMGDKRKSLVEQFGYDTKNAAHLIRLLRMGIEFMVDGELQVERQDAPELLGIKTGKWTLEEVKAEAERLFAVAEQAYINSSLPPKVDMKRISRLSVDVVRAAWEERK